MKIIRTVAPVLEPITVAELKLHLRLDEEIIGDDETTIEDSLLEDLIATARDYVEDITRRALLTQTWDYYPQAWPAGDYITLPYGNLQSVTSIKYKDTDGDETTLTSGTDYLVETNGEQCGRIVLPYGETWPSDVMYPSNPITIKYVCGWTAAASIPAKIRIAVKMIAAGLYANRGEYSADEDQTVQRLLMSSRLWEEIVL